MRDNAHATLARLLAGLIAAAAVLVFFLPVAFTEEAAPHIEMVPTDAFGEIERPAVAFRHDEHNEKAGIGTYDDCIVCHHSGAGCELEEGVDSQGVPCSECHQVVSEEACRPSLMEAYHTQCWGCHENKGGPVACGECHVK